MRSHQRAVSAEDFDASTRAEGRGAGAGHHGPSSVDEAQGDVECVVGGGLDGLSRVRVDSVAEVGIQLARNRFNLTEPVAQAVDVVRAEPSEEASARRSVVSAAEGSGMETSARADDQLQERHVKLADVAFIDKLLHPHTAQREPELMGDHACESGILGLLPRLAGLRLIEREGLFADDVLSGVEGLHRHLVVVGDGADDAHSVETVHLEHFSVVGEGFGDAEPLSSLGGSFLSSSAHRHNVQTLGLKGRDVDGGPESHSDNAYPHTRLCHC